jgi:hypothetical protein
LDGGSASRAGILKQANQPKTKGNLLIHGRPLCHHIRDSLAPLATKLGPDYIVLSSCDDLISLDPVYFDRLAGEIHRQSLPFFWLDNDDPSKLPIYPMTTQDMLLFVEQHGLGSPQRQGEFLRIMDQVPPAKGPIESNQINDAAQIARFFGDFYQERGANNQQNGKSSQNSMAILGSVSPLISDYLRTWLSYRSMTDASGSKTPFLFIMRKDFGQKLLKIMHNHFHDFQYTDMTWESTIVRAFKSDETFWSMNKPSTVPTADWNAFYAEMQQLKVDSGILTRRDRQQERNDKKVTQMKMRLLPLNWNNFDDPYSIFTYFTRNAGDNSDSIHFTRMVSVSIDGDEQRRRIRHKLIVISDRPINKPVTVRLRKA